jgi:NAD(P)-dependent dehydrogenase (short-subunit alcohol dehydrogenase family)
MTSQTIVITGASGKIGARLTRHFRGKGWTVVAISRSREKLDELAGSTEGPGPIEKVTLDISEPNCAQRLAAILLSRGALPDHLVNNARDVTNLKLSASGHPERAQWIREFELGVAAAHDLAFALAEIENSRLRSVVNIASMYGVVAMNPHLYTNAAQDAPIHYSVTKAALIHLTKELAVRLAGRGIRVNCVSYGGVAGRVDAEFQNRYATLAPSRAMLSDEDVPGAVDFLTSPGASAITGHNLLVDGGWTIW